MCDKCEELTNDIKVLETKVSDLEGNVSVITQMINSIDLKVSGKSR